jgi:hypothetical protein
MARQTPPAARMKLARAASATDSRRVGLLRQRLPRHGAGRGHVPAASRASARSSPVSLRGLLRPARPVGLLVELDLPRAMHLLVHIHAVDHLADGVFQAGRIFLKLDHLLIEVLRQHKSLRHVVMHRGHATASTFCW